VALINFVDDTDDDRSDRTGVDAVHLTGRRALIKNQDLVARPGIDSVRTDQIIPRRNRSVDEIAHQQLLPLEERVVDRRRDRPDDLADLHGDPSTASTIPTIA